MKKVILIIFIALIAFTSACNFNNKNENIIEYSSDNLEYLEEFVQIKLMDSEGGIYTNYRIEQKNEMAKGHEILSESMGLYLLYKHYMNDKAGFDKTLKYIQDKMLFEEGLFYWKINGEDTYVNATLDDLRIAKAVYFQNEERYDKQKDKLLDDIAASIYEKCTIEGILVNFYEETTSLKSDLINLSYIDIEALHCLSSYNSNITDIIGENYKILENGFIEKDFPIYYKEYDTKNKEYIKDGKINTIEILYTFLHLAQINKLKTESINWLIENFEKDSLYASYDIRSRSGVDKFESTAVYALISRIFLELDKKELYNKAIIKMLNYQVLDSNSEIFGSFGDIHSEDVYSFDNLNALIALIQYEKKVN